MTYFSTTTNLLSHDYIYWIKKQNQRRAKFWDGQHLHVRMITHLKKTHVNVWQYKWHVVAQILHGWDPLCWNFGWNSNLHSSLSVLHVLSSLLPFMLLVLLIEDYALTFLYIWKIRACRQRLISLFSCYSLWKFMEGNDNRYLPCSVQPII